MKEWAGDKHIKIWDQVWREDVYATPDLRKIKAKKKADIFLNKFSERISENTTILDIGCGNGYVSEYILKETLANVLAFDQSSEALKRCERLRGNPRFHLRQGNAEEIPYSDEKADIVFCIGVLEHIKDWRKCLEEIKRVLKPGGYVYLVSSNIFSAMYLQWVWCHITGKWKYGYQNNLRPNRLKKMLEEYSFETQDYMVIEGWGDHDALSLVDHFFRFFSKSIGRYIIYIGRKKQ